jgi:hypothetical protein
MAHDQPKNSPIFESLGEAYSRRVRATAIAAAKAMNGYQPTLEQRAQLGRALGGVKPSPISYAPPVKVSTGLVPKAAALALAQGKPLVSDAVQRMATQGFVSSEVHRQALAAVKPVSTEAAKMIAQPSGLSPLAQALVKSRSRSPALGGVFAPSAERIEQIQRAFGQLGVAGELTTPAGSVSPIKQPRPQLSPPREAAIRNPILDPQLPARPRRQRPARVRKAVPERRPLQPQQLGEAVAHSLFRTHHQEAEQLLLEGGFDLELEHLRAVEQRLATGTRPDRLHAALSTNLLLQGLADRLFPARDGHWVCRFNKKHELGARNVSNRLSAFVDPMLRRRLSTKGHALFQAAIDYVFRWSAEGHHVVSTPREAAEAYCHLLRVLAAIAQARREAVQLAP